MIWLYAAAALVIGFFGLAGFERVAPRRLLRLWWRAVNPPMRLVAGRIPGLILLETTGGRTGRRHQVPVGGRRHANAVWLVAGHASKSHYVKNIAMHPRVRLRMGSRWLDGTAHVLSASDAPQGFRRAGWINASFVRLASSDVRAIRIDLA